MNKPRISIVVAIDEKRGIGKNNDLLFKIPEDLKRFRQLTNGHAIIMGRRTYESIGRILPDRWNIVLTKDYSMDGQYIDEYHNPTMYHDIKFALQRANKYELDTNKESQEIFIIGGGQIFKEALENDMVDRLYVTLVKGDYKADTFFSDYEQFGFKKEIEKEERDSDGYQYTFLTLEK